MDYIIETENLTKRYGTATVVDKVNLHVPKGKIYGLLGRNGAGKTTAMKMMLQLAFPTEGTVRLFGTNYKENIHTLYSKVGSIIETPGFYSNLTGYENLQILAKLRGGVSKSGVEKALEVVGLHKEKRKVFSDYSLGMKQRLGIAAAIMHEPELLILDEPINGLDPIGIVEIRSFLSELSHNHGITIFISSHVLSEIEQIADIIGVMHEGHLVEEVNISELHKRNRKYIQFDLSDSEIAGKILENHYHMTDFTVQDGTVRIYDFKGIRLCGIGRALDGDRPLVVGAGGGTPGAVFLLHIHSHTTVHADAIVAACLSGSRQEDIAQRLHRALPHHAVGRNAVDAVRPLPGVVWAEFRIRYQ